MEPAERGKSLSTRFVGGTAGRRGAAGLAVSLVLALAALTGCTAAPAMTEQATDPTETERVRLRDVSVPRLTWEPCADGLECADAELPLDYDEPDGAQVQLALVRLPAADPDARIGSLFTNPGGPGASGIGWVRGNATTFVPDEVRQRFDIIGLDPRGVGQSTPVQCFDSAQEQTVSLAQGTGWPADVADAPEFARLQDELAGECAERSGKLLEHLSTANVARDLEMLRRAVDDEALSFHGLSYGTYLGITYASLFPDKVRALVLDGVVAPEAYAGADAPEGTAPWLRANAHLGTQDAVEQFFALCADSADTCALGGPDPEGAYTDLVAALDKEPLGYDQPGVGPSEFDSSDVGLALQVGLYTPAGWAQTADFLHQMHTLIVLEQDRGAAVELLESAGQAAPGGAQGDEPPAPTEREANLASHCADVDAPGRSGEFAEAAEAERERAPYTVDRWAWASGPCAAWPGPDEDRYTGPFEPVTADPVLVVGTRHDPATPYHNAEELAGDLPGAGLLTMEGWGHTASFGARSSCTDEAVATYLIDLELPPDGETCAPDPAAVPFAASAG